MRRSSAHDFSTVRTTVSSPEIFCVNLMSKDDKISSFPSGSTASHAELNVLRSSRRVSENNTQIRDELTRIFGGNTSGEPPVSSTPPSRSVKRPPPPPPLADASETPSPPSIVDISKAPSSQPVMAASSEASSELHNLCQRIAEKVDRLEQKFRDRYPVAATTTMRAEHPPLYTRGRRRPREIERSLRNAHR